MFGSARSRVWSLKNSDDRDRRHSYLYLQMMKPRLEILSGKSHVDICVFSRAFYRKQPEAVSRERNYW